MSTIKNETFVKALKIASNPNEIERSLQVADMIIEIKCLVEENKKLKSVIKEQVGVLREFCLVYDQHVPSGASSFRVEADSLIREYEKNAR